MKFYGNGIVVIDAETRVKFEGPNLATQTGVYDTKKAKLTASKEKLITDTLKAKGFKTTPSRFPWAEAHTEVIV